MNILIYTFCVGFALFNPKMIPSLSLRLSVSNSLSSLLNLSISTSLSCLLYLSLSRSLCLALSIDTLTLSYSLLTFYLSLFTFSIHFLSLSFSISLALSLFSTFKRFFVCKVVKIKFQQKYTIVHTFC